MKFSLKKVMLTSAVTVTTIVFICFGERTDNKKVDFIGYSSYSFGQIEKGTSSPGGAEDAAMSHAWIQEVYTGVGFHAALTDRLIINAGLEGKMWNGYSDPSRNNGKQFHLRNYSLWLDQGNADYTIGDVANPWLTLTAGYFKYKYNPEARNLGEQVFRSLPYPGVLIDFFDFSAARLLGYKAHFNLLEGMLKADAMVISETDWAPFGDFSPALFATCKPVKAVEIGAGVEFSRLFSVNNTLTTPSSLLGGNAPAYIVHAVRDSTGAVVNTVNDTTSFYTFKSTKLMGRATFDPKTLLDPSSLALFGPEDGKIYGEIDVLGVKNYSFLYEDISKRMPIMFGFNVPTFKVLDVLSIEGEYYKYPFQTDYNDLLQKAEPLPADANEAVAWYNGGQGDQYNYQWWKWSVYGKKMVVPGFTITLQIARDHFRTTNPNTGLPNEFTEVCSGVGLWHWAAKLCYNL